MSIAENTPFQTFFSLQTENYSGISDMSEIPTQFMSIQFTPCQMWFNSGYCKWVTHG